MGLMGWGLGKHVTLTASSTGLLLQLDDSWSAATAGPGTQASKVDTTSRDYFRAAERTPGRPGAHSAHQLRDSDLPPPPPGARPAPSLRAQLAPRRACAGAVAAAEHPGECSPCRSRWASKSCIPAEPGEVGTLSPSASLFPSSHLPGHLALVLHPHTLSVREGAPEGERETPCCLQRAVLRRRVHCPPPSSPPPLPAGVGPLPEERRRSPRRPQRGRRRRAPRAMPLPGRSGGGRRERRRRRRGSRRGAAAAAAEGPRAGGGGGEGHRRRR